MRGKISDRAGILTMHPTAGYLPLVAPPPLPPPPPSAPTHNWIEAVRFGDDGLVPVVAQSALAGEVLMVGYADREALAQTQATRQAHYHSRARHALWRQGEPSAHTQRVV